MKKKLFGITIVAAIALMAGWNFSQKDNEVKLFDLALDNTDALASGESGCPNGCYDNGNGCYCNGWYWTYREA